MKLKLIKHGLAMLLALLIHTSMYSQDTLDVCVNATDNLLLDLTQYGINNGREVGGNKCFVVSQERFLVWEEGDGLMCCGDHEVLIQDIQTQEEVTINITVKCPKPDCFITEMTSGTDDPAGQSTPAQVYACSNSSTTYFLLDNPDYTYDWSTDQGDTGSGSSIEVIWNTPGTHTITVVIMDGATIVDIITKTVEVLAAPVADFTKSASYICKDGTISFDASSSVGGSQFFWEFSDGETAEGMIVSRDFDTGGTYTVTLTVTGDNYDDRGNPLCCCSDTMSMEIEVDDLEGPPIYWISTLCEGDSSLYWTDADCTTLNWVVTDASGNTLAYTSISPDTISVVWPSGPVGYVSLDVSGCTSVYCTEPSIAAVPIISTISDIVGEEKVCFGLPYTYSVPKWRGVMYEWTVTGGTAISNGNTVTVIWDDPTATIGTISVDYHNEFLSGLMMADPCIGSGYQEIQIRPKYSLFGQDKVCVGDMSTVTSDGSGSSFTWSISPASTNVINVTAPDQVSIEWNEAGVYTITAVPVDPDDFCNEVATHTVLVDEVRPALDIAGTIEVCPNTPYLYTAISDESNVNFIWTALGGTPISSTGSTTSIEWDPSATMHVLTLVQQGIEAPMCESTPIDITVDLLELDPGISVSDDSGCINQIENYTATGSQPAQASIIWSVDPPSAGSVVGGQGTPSVNIQWNNDAIPATLIYTVALCGDTISTDATITLIAPDVATIVQTGFLCPGGTAMLEATPGFSNYEWSTGDNGPSNMTTITAPGIYTLTTTDANGCMDKTFFEAEPSALPTAFISTNDLLNCIGTVNPPNTVNISALEGPNYGFVWTCNGTDVYPGDLTQSTLSHINTYVPETFVYQVTVIDTVTGCESESNFITLVQAPCGGLPCTPDPHTLTISGMVDDPVYCNIWKFTETHSPNVTPSSWSFGDGSTASYSSNMINHTYSMAGLYSAWISGSVTGTPGNCSTSEQTPISVPLGADFTYEDSCLVVQFTDQSTYLPGEDIMGWSWTFGDGGTSSDINPSYMYASPGTYTVTLIVTGVGGCKAIWQENVTVSTGGSPIISIVPDPVCVGEAAVFTGNHPGDVVDWLWDFSNGSTNGSQIAEQSFETSGLKVITLTTYTTNGCTSSAMANLVVNPLPAIDEIMYTGNLTLCPGETITLSVPLLAGVTYLWNDAAMSTSNSIVVSESGDYTVTATLNNCSVTTEPVTVDVLPETVVNINGPHYICEGDCITLEGPLGAVNYQWLDEALNPIIGQTGSSISFCHGSHPPEVFLMIEDDNGCDFISDAFEIQSADQPTVSISVIGDLCEGSDNLLIATVGAPFVNSDFDFIWSNGETTNSITTSLPLQYTVQAIHKVTGCAATATVQINPLPDFCIMPSGCYTVCIPDTLYGPEGLAAYQWNLDGNPIPGANMSSYIVTMQGSYSLTGTTDQGCTATSDTLILEVKNCYDCENTDFTFTRLPYSPQEPNCCYNFEYSTDLVDIIGIEIRTDDADIVVSNLGSDFALAGNVGGTASVVSSTPGGTIPSGSVTNLFDICLTNVTADPQMVIFDWVHAVDGVICSDTVFLECDISHDCAYIQKLDIICIGDSKFVTFDLCNPITGLFPIGYVEFFTAGPTFFGLVPLAIDLTGSEIVPGDCVSLMLEITEPGLEYEEMCLGAIVHEANPDEKPDARCCTLEETYCDIVPGCDPCEQTYSEAVRDDSSSDCCYDLTFFNGYDDASITYLDISTITPGTTIGINNPVASDWAATDITATSMTLNYIPGFVGLGSTVLPQLCIINTTSPVQEVVIGFVDANGVECYDTLRLSCEPPCGFVRKESFTCQSDGTWMWEAIIKNTGDVTISEIDITFPIGSGLEIYNTTITGLSLAPGAISAPIYIPIGAPAVALKEICVTVSMHATDHNDDHTSCCNFKHCFTLPECGEPDPCSCEDLEEDLAAGINCSDLGDDRFGFSGVALTECDKVQWFVDGKIIGTISGNQSIAFQFTSPGEYEVCMRVSRNGGECTGTFCKEVEIAGQQAVEIVAYPNPTIDQLNVDIRDLSIIKSAKVTLSDSRNQTVLSFDALPGTTLITLPTSSLAAGLYLLEVRNEDEYYFKKILIVN